MTTTKKKTRKNTPLKYTVGNVYKTQLEALKVELEKEGK
jgi:hypothetical protein